MAVGLTLLLGCWGQGARAHPDHATADAEALEAAFFHQSGTFFENRSLGAQADTLLGLQGYPKRAIASDAERADRVYRQLLER